MNFTCKIEDVGIDLQKANSFLPLANLNGNKAVSSWKVEELLLKNHVLDLLLICWKHVIHIPLPGVIPKDIWWLCAKFKIVLL